MEIQVALIRSGATRWNREGLLQGMADEPIDARGRLALRDKTSAGRYPETRLVFCSDRARALQTAQLLYPGAPAIVHNGLRPFDYGEFTGLPFGALDVDKRFAEWIEGDDMKRCPGGGDPHAHWALCRRTFADIVAEAQLKGLGVAVISHLSVILTVLRQYHIPRPVYLNWQIPCGGGVAACFNPQSGALHITGEL